MTYYQKTDLIDNLYAIEFDQPLLLLSNEEVDAYVCSSVQGGDQKLVAYVLKTDYPPRLNIFKKAGNGILSEEVVVCAKVHGIIADDDIYKYVVITSIEQDVATRTSALQYDKDLNKHYIPEFKAMNHSDDIMQILGSLYKTLVYLESVGMYHGAIRPDNIFFDVEGGVHRVKLGGCFLKPTGADQPLLYETINRGMCKPSTRGAGTISDEIYSLGVSLAVFFLGQEPLNTLTEEEILLKKIDEGSYKALLKDIKLPPVLAILFKGLLCDNALHRWEIEDIEKWLATRRGRKILTREHKVKRAIAIGDIHCHSKRSAAYAISKHKHEAMALLIGGKIQAWLDYACEDSVARQAVSVLLEQFQQGKMSDDHFITEVCAAMAPENPMFYAGLVLCPNSLSKVIFESAVNVKMRELLRALLLNNVFMSWLSSQESGSYLGQFGSIDQYRTLYKGQGVNRGFEALFYKLNMNAYCESSFVKKYKPNTISELLEGLEKVAGEVDMNEAVPMDKELMCFIDARGNGLVAPFAVDLNASNDQVSSMNALVSLYAMLQAKYLNRPLPHLAKWFGQIILKNFSSLKDKNEFIRLNKLLKKSLKSGMLQDLSGLVSEDVYKGDDIRFNYSRRAYEQMNGAIDELQSYLTNTALLYEKVGRPFSAFVAIGISMIIMFTSLVILVGG